MQIYKCCIDLAVVIDALINLDIHCDLKSSLVWCMQLVRPSGIYVNNLFAHAVFTSAMSTPSLKKSNTNKDAQIEIIKS